MTQIKYGIISVDDHVQEPPDLWTSRMSRPAWGDRIPHIEQAADGTEHWVVDGQVLLGGKVAQAGAFMDERLAEADRWDGVPPAAYIPAERLKIMDAARVDYSALFPTVAGLAGTAFGSLSDPELELACVQAYNDWLIEAWAGASERFIPQCLVPLSSVQATVREIERAVKMGHKGVVFPAMPMNLRDTPHVSDHEFDAVWSVCEELDVPLCLHAGASSDLQYAPLEGLKPALAGALEQVTRSVSSVFVISLFALSRILLRHPRLRVVLAESGLSWGTLYMEWADHQFEHDGLRAEGYDLAPSEMFRRQCFFTSWFDQVAPFESHIGAEHILWSTNLPLVTSSWPNTQKTIERCFEGVSQQSREMVLWRNAASLYRL
jgi:predicted TIM-barrel fold metal-dependent hydrolase